MNTKLDFTYSRPYEHSLLKLSGEKPSKKHDEKGFAVTKLAGEIWKPYESKVVKLFSEMYKIDIEEERIEVFISLVLWSSYSHPMTIGIKKFKLGKSKRGEIGYISTVIHELAHYFAYTRPKDSYFRSLYKKVLDKDLLESAGANLHFLINAVEYGIGAEVMSKENAERRREFVIENHPEKYSKASKLLKKKNIPLSKDCLEYIEEEILTS